MGNHSHSQVACVASTFGKLARRGDQRIATMMLVTMWSVDCFNLLTCNDIRPLREPSSLRRSILIVI